MSCLYLCIAAMAGHVDLPASPLDEARAYLYTIRTSPVDIEIAELPGGCSADRLTIFRKIGKIVRILYDAGGGCAADSSFQLEQFFSAAGIPVYTAFRHCPQLQSDCISGQLFFSNHKVVHSAQYWIRLKTAADPAHTSKIVVATEKGIPFCNGADIHIYSGKRCYFASSDDVAAYLKTRLSPGNLSGAFASVTKGTFPGVFPPFGRHHMVHINADLVRLRETPAVNGAILDLLHPFEAAVVMEKGKSEEIFPWGIHPWYRAKVNGKSGWIFGAFMDLQLPDAGTLTNVEITRLVPVTTSSGQELAITFTHSDSFSPDRAGCAISAETGSETCGLNLNFRPERKTNLREAYLSILAGNQKRACRKEDFLGGSPDTGEKRKRENGIEYQVLVTQEGAAGMHIHRRIYLWYAKDRCRCVIYHFATTAIQNRPEGSVTEFDRERAEAGFDRVRRSIVWE